ncbi:MAG TPA: DEAD/DEAH box helicase family protein, partial [Syntrophobacteria bacterium]|nr:DEAD/DEAH box helicase family protein [Syntrophobacteria bacterium]
GCDVRQISCSPGGREKAASVPAVAGRFSGDRVLEVMTAGMHKTVTIFISERIKVPASLVPPMFIKKLNERLVFTNPEYELRQSRGEWLGNVPVQVRCLYEQRRQFFIPRGFLAQLLELCQRFNITYRLIDRQRTVDPVEFEFHGMLKGYQERAFSTITSRDHGTLVGDAKSGKTVIALRMIAHRHQPTMILVPNTSLLDHWKEKLVRFLNLPPDEIGIVGQGGFKIGPRVTVAHVSAMYRRVREVRESIGFLIVDECHRTPARTFTQVVSNFDCRYLLGLAATTPRRDRLSRLIYYYVGDILYQIDTRDATENRGLLQAEVVVRETEFSYPYESSEDYRSMIAALAKDPERNRLIVADVEKELSDRGVEPLLVLTEEETQVNAIEDLLRARGISCAYIDAGVSREGKEQFFSQLKEGKVQVVLASRDFLQESIPEGRYGALFLITPLSFQGRISDHLHKLLTRRNGQPPMRVYDYVDSKVSILDNFFRMRSYAYGLRLPKTA